MTVRITKIIVFGVSVLHIDGQLRMENVSALMSEYRELTRFGRIGLVSAAVGGRDRGGRSS